MAAELSKDLDACKLSISQLEETIGDSDTDSGKLNDNISECEKKIAEKKELIFQTKQELSGADEKIAAAQKMAEQAQREHIELDNAANKLRTKQKHKMDEKETLSGQITRAEEQKKSVTAGFDKLVAQLWDDYDLAWRLNVYLNTTFKYIVWVCENKLALTTTKKLGEYFLEVRIYTFKAVGEHILHIFCQILDKFFKFCF